MSTYQLTQGELSTLLYCLESQAVDFSEGDDSTAEFQSVFAKLEALADKTPDPEDLDRVIAHISLSNQ